MSEKQKKGENGIDRRTALKAVGIAGVGMYGFSGAAVAGGGPPDKCECPEDTFLAKYDFECVEEECVEYDEEECEEYECVEWDFVLAEGEDIVDITVTEVKDGDDSEPITVEFEADGFRIDEVCAFGGNDTDTEEFGDSEGTFETDLENNGGQQAAISNLTFCGEEDEPEPEAVCDIYGIDRSTDEQAIRGISTPAVDVGGPVANAVEDIVPNDDSINFPNGLAYDGEVWYFSGRDSEYEDGWDDVDETPEPFESGRGSLFTFEPFDEIVEYGQLADGERVAGAAFYDGEYYFIDQGNRNTLDKVSVEVGDPNSMTDRVEVADLEDVTGDLGPTLLGDVAISTDGVAYTIFRAPNEDKNFFVSVDLDGGDVTLINEEEVDDPSEATEAIAGGRQIGFGVNEDGDEALYVHEEADFGSPYPWWVVEDPDNASRDTDDEDFTTAENFTDLASCAPDERS